MLEWECEDREGGRWVQAGLPESICCDSLSALSASGSPSQLKVMSRQMNLADITHLMFVQQQMDHTWWLLFVISIGCEGGVDTEGKRGNDAGVTRWIDSDDWCRTRLSSSDNNKHGLFVQMLKTTPFTFSVTWNSCDRADDCPFSVAKGGSTVMSAQYTLYFF